MGDISSGKPKPPANVTSESRLGAGRSTGAVAKVVQRLPGGGPLMHFFSRFTRRAAPPATARADRGTHLHTTDSDFPPSGPFIAGDVPESEKEIAERLLKYVRTRRNAYDGWILFDQLGQATKVNRMFFSLFGLKEEDVRGCSPEEVLATISLACDLQGDFPQISYLSMGIFNKPTQNKNYSCVFKISIPEKRLMQVIRCELGSVKYGSLLLFSDVSHLPIVDVMMAQSIPGLNDFQKILPDIHRPEANSIIPDLIKNNQAVGRQHATGPLAAERHGP